MTIDPTITRCLPDKSVGVIRDLPSASDVVRTIADGAWRVMQNLVIE